MKCSLAIIWLLLLRFSYGSTNSQTQLPTGGTTVGTTPTARPRNFTELFLKKIPVEMFRLVYDQHVQTDAQFQAALKYLQSNEWKKLLEDARTTPEWVKFKAHLNRIGLSIDYMVQRVCEMADHVNLTTVDTEGVHPTLKNYFTDLRDKYVVALYHAFSQLLADFNENQDMRDFVNELSGHETKELFETAIGTPNVVSVLKKITDLGCDVKFILFGLYKMHGWDVENIAIF